MHPASTASLRVASSSFAVMKLTGHFDPDAASRRCSSIPEIPPSWMSSSRHVAVCALPFSSKASAEANVRLSMPLCATGEPRPSESPHCHRPRSRPSAALPYRVQLRWARLCAQVARRPLIWIKEIWSAVNSQAASSRVRIDNCWRTSCVILTGCGVFVLEQKAFMVGYLGFTQTKGERP
jgi:hypothetical protein